MDRYTTCSEALCMAARKAIVAVYHCSNTSTNNIHQRMYRNKGSRTINNNKSRNNKRRNNNNNTKCRSLRIHIRDLLQQRD